jgi:NTE family protein
MEARWKTLRQVRNLATFANPKDPVAVAITNVSDAELYVVDVSFAALNDKAERAFLNELPTSFVLKDEEGRPPARGSSKDRPGLA